jgi:hypothetical protein
MKSLQRLFSSNNTSTSAAARSSSPGQAHGERQPVVQPELLPPRPRSSTPSATDEKLQDALQDAG